MKIPLFRGLRLSAMSEIVCDVCFHHCVLREGRRGFCRARENRDGMNVCVNAGLFTSAALDPIEKKPLKRFFPGSYILSVGSFGCNLACPFCQNHEISMHEEDAVYYQISSSQMVDLVRKTEDSIGIAFTYNEPLISWEYILETAKGVHEAGKKVVLVSNGTAEKHILEKLMPYVDAMNIDYKGDEAFYKELSGSHETVRNTIAYVHDKCHLEVTTLIIPGKNDDPVFIEETAIWLASLNKDIPLHLTRYFPAYRYTIPPIRKEKLFDLCAIAEKHLRYVYPGNV